MSAGLGPRGDRVGRRGSPPSRGKATKWRPGVEGLEGRQLMAGVRPDIAMIGAMTTDSRSVVVDYEIRGADVARPFDIGIYRSADDRRDAGDQLVETYRVDPSAVDVDGRPAASFGEHRLVIVVADGLAINPQHPYVLASADPGRAVDQSDLDNDTASFRKYSLAIITHGGLQETQNERIPAWQNRLAKAVSAEGFDETLPFNWVAVSKSPGSAAKQGLRLAAQVRKAVEGFPEGAPVDLQFIGHSEGAIVDSVALQDLSRDSLPEIDAGFIKHTMLDPHAANNGFPLKQYSVKDSFMGNVARDLINQYQSRARDPFASVPANVDEAEVYYQHTYYAMAQGTNWDSKYFNLWGQVPVKGPGEATYTDITGPGISHSGDFSVVDWYLTNVVPTLGGGHPYQGGSLITAQIDARDGSSEPESLQGRKYWLATRPSVITADVNTPRFEGTARPGSEVTLTAARGGGAIRLGRAEAGADGTWEIESRRLADGRYSLILTGSVPASQEHPRVRSTPRITLGTLVVDTSRERS